MLPPTQLLANDTLLTALLPFDTAGMRGYCAANGKPGFVQITIVFQSVDIDQEALFSVYTLRVASLTTV